MELWLMEKSTLHALVELSGTRNPLSDEAIDAIYRVRSRKKIEKFAHQTFYGSLELELFSGFDLQGSETILALQQRVATALIPHDVPDKKDATMLLEIIKENAQGRHVAYYWYMWCEVLSATFFERFKDAYAQDPEYVSQLRVDLRRMLLEPGANADVEGFRTKFGLNGCSPEPLWKRYGL